MPYNQSALSSNRIELSLNQQKPLINAKTSGPATLYVSAESNWPQTIAGVADTYPRIPLDIILTIRRRTGNFVFSTDIPLPTVGLCIPVLTDEISVDCRYTAAQGLADPWPSYIVQSAVLPGVLPERPVFRNYSGNLAHSSLAIFTIPPFTAEFRVDSIHFGKLYFFYLKPTLSSISYSTNDADEYYEWSPIPIEGAYAIYYVSVAESNTDTVMMEFR